MSEATLHGALVHIPSGWIDHTEFRFLAEAAPQNPLTTPLAKTRQLPPMRPAVVIRRAARTEGQPLVELLEGAHPTPPWRIVTRGTCSYLNQEAVFEDADQLLPQDGAIRQRLLVVAVHDHVVTISVTGRAADVAYASAGLQRGGAGRQ